MSLEYKYKILLDALIAPYYQYLNLYFNNTILSKKTQHPLNKGVYK